MKYLITILALISIVGCDLPAPKQAEEHYTNVSTADGSFNDSDSGSGVDFHAEISSNDTANVDSTVNQQLISDSTLVHNLIMDFDSCSYYAVAMLNSDGELLEDNRHNGNNFYNQAYYRVLHADEYALVGSEKKVLSSAMSFFAEIFNNHDIGGGFSSDLAYQTAQVHSLLNPQAAAAEKPDNKFIVNLDYLYKQGVRLPSKGNWCLWEMKGGQRIWIEGDLGGQNGFGRFDIRAEKLPIYLGDSKYFTITNAADEPGQSIQLIFQPCERN